MKHSHWLAAAVPLLLLGCTDRQPLATDPAAPPPAPSLAAYECRADVRARAPYAAPSPRPGATPAR